MLQTLSAGVTQSVIEAGKKRMAYLKVGLKGFTIVGERKRAGVNVSPEKRGMIRQFLRSAIAQIWYIRAVIIKTRSGWTQFMAASRRSLSIWERAGIIAIFVFFAGFAVDVEIRGAFLRRHMTDVEVYFRAAWCARTGQDMYEIPDLNNWHYCYPPTLAVLLMPFASTPPGGERVPAIPYPLSVAIWYVFSVVCIGVSIHWLATALERAAPAPGPEPGARRWWAFRIVPLFFSLPVFGHSLVRGQVGALWLLLLCGMIAALIRKQSWRAGLYLAGMICLKLIPAFLLIYPVWRRDWRCLAGCALGLVVGAAVIPAAGLGFSGMVRTYSQYERVLLRPGWEGTLDPVRAKELTDLRTTDTQSFAAVFNNTTHPDLVHSRQKLPANVAPVVRRGILLLAALMTLFTLWAVGWKRAGWAPGIALGLGALMLVLMPISPVFHPHYLVLLVPVMMGLQAAWGVGNRWLLGMFGAHFVIFVVTAIPQWAAPRYFGMVLYETVFFWAVAVAVLVKHRHESSMGTEEPLDQRGVCTRFWERQERHGTIPSVKIK